MFYIFCFLSDFMFFVDVNVYKSLIDNDYHWWDNFVFHVFSVRVKPRTNNKLIINCPNNLRGYVAYSHTTFHLIGGFSWSSPGRTLRAAKSHSICFCCCCFFLFFVFCRGVYTLHHLSVIFIIHCFDSFWLNFQNGGFKMVAVRKS